MGDKKESSFGIVYTADLFYSSFSESIPRRSRIHEV